MRLCVVLCSLFFVDRPGRARSLRDHSKGDPSYGSVHCRRLERRRSLGALWLLPGGDLVGGAVLAVGTWGPDDNSEREGAACGWRIRGRNFAITVEVQSNAEMVAPFIEEFGPPFSIDVNSRVIGTPIVLPGFPSREENNASEDSDHWILAMNLRGEFP